MKMKKLNNYLFQKRAQKYLSTTDRERRFVSYNQAKTVLLLFESEFSEKNPIIRKMIFSLQQDGKKVCAWGFIDKKEVATSILPDFRILHHKQTDFFEKPLESYINELESKEYDLLIDLSLRPILTLQYIALYANAAFKTGIHNTDLPIYDFIVDVNNIEVTHETEESPVDELYLFNQIIFYLKSIQSND